MRNENIESRIIEYVDTMFSDFPKTRKVIDIKNDIIDSMIEKCEELLTEGKSESEAVAIAISQFGNIDELKREFDVGQDEYREDQYIESSFLKQYLRFRRKFAFWIALGVFLIIAALAVVSVLNKDGVIAIVLLPTVALSVLIFIIAGFSNGRYDHLEEDGYLLERDDRIWVTKEHQRFRTPFIIMIASGVVLCILGAVLTMVVQQVYSMSAKEAGFAFLGCVAVGVFLFIYSGVIYGTYEDLLAQRPKANEPCEQQYEYLYGVVMPIASMVYLLMGFVWDLWHPGWLIFPVCAILVTAFIEVMKNVRK